MANISGLGESFAANAVEFARVEFDLAKNKYYNTNRNGILFLNNFGMIPGDNMTPDQKKVRLALESQVLDQMQFEIMTHEAKLTQQTTLVTGTLPTGSRGSTNTLTVADSSVLRPFDVIENMTTSEYLFVVSIDSASAITVYPAFSQTGFSGNTTFPWSLSNASAQAKTNGDVIRVVGTAFVEGSTESSIIDSRPTTAVNYMQIFREDYGTTFEEANTKKNGRMDLEDKEERAKGNLLTKMEKAIIESGINSQTVTVSSVSGTSRAMQGFRGTISTYNQASSALVGAGNDRTVPKIDQIIDQVAGANQSGKIIGLDSGTGIRKFRELMDNKVVVHVAVGSDTFGIKALVYEGQVPVYYVRHEVMDATGNSDETLYFDTDKYELVNLRNGQLGKVTEKKGMPASTLAANNKMAFQDAHYGAYSLKYRDEEASARITGQVYTISS